MRHNGGSLTLGTVQASVMNESIPLHQHLAYLLLALARPTVHSSARAGWSGCQGHDQQRPAAQEG